MNERMAAFVEEAQDLLARLEAALLEAEEFHGHEVGESVESVNAIFRCMHTLKGTAGMVGYSELVGLADELESAYALVRAGELLLDARLAGVSLRFKDLVQRFISSPEDGICQTAGAALVEDLRAITGATPVGTVPADQTDASRDAVHAAARQNRFRIRYAPGGVPLDAVNPEAILEQLRGLGQVSLRADLSNLPELDVCDPRCCHLAWDILLETDRGEDALEDMLFLVDGPAEVLTWHREPEPRESSPARPDAATRRAISARSGDSAGAPAPARERPQERTAESIRVSTDKLDDLVDLVGRVVIAQVRLRQIESELGNPLLTSVVEEMERLGDMLRDRTLSLRMLPIGSGFSRFRRLVHDLSGELGKEIDLVTSGEETELDKTVIERLGDPLVHIIRNAMDHGLETPVEREAAGKPRRGTVRLAASQESGRVRIVVSDDGRGIDTDKVLAKAVLNGLTRGEPRPSDEEIFGFLFEPGFSTAASVTSVSGRGVGMDVVKKAVEELKGAVRVESRFGEGTSITISLPLTLAIIDGLHVHVGGEQYVLPLADVVECEEIARPAEARMRVRSTVEIRERLVPCLGLRRYFQVPGDGPEIEQVVVVNSPMGLVGLVVDGIIGQRQTVIKGLGRLFSGLTGVSGATIMGDGSLALILDVASMLREAQT